MRNTIVLVRHSTAERFSANGDLGRALTPEGQEQAIELGKLLVKELGPSVDCLVASHAVRAQETADAIGQNLKIENLWMDRAIYDSDVDSLREIVHSCERKTLVIVGHEPTISVFAAALICDDCPGRELVYGGVPTASAIVLKTDLPFDQVCCGSCDLEAFLHAEIG
ncbi:SixA phosphatase family protein [Boudabousia liubingyangii]|nr:phosphoglycerate mutase family protein [Boudabousia liubingyangii]